MPRQTQQLPLPIAVPNSTPELKSPASPSTPPTSQPPSNPQVQVTPSSPQTPRSPALPLLRPIDLHIATRLANLHNTLASIRHTFSIRAYFLAHNLRHHYYCRTCTPHNHTGSCGPTCPLLRPSSRVTKMPYPVSEASRIRWDLDRDLYRRIVAEVEYFGCSPAGGSSKASEAGKLDAQGSGHGRQVTIARLQTWERAAEAIMRGLRSGSEKHAVNGWANVGKCRAGWVGVKRGWEFTRAWGVDGEGEEVVSPKMKVVVKEVRIEKRRVMWKARRNPVRAARGKKIVE